MVIAQTRPFDSTAIAKLEDRIRDVQRDWSVPGLAVAVVQHGKVVYRKGHGVRDIETGERVTRDTIFAIGSASKPLTSLCLTLLLKDAGANWNDPVSQHWPDFPIAAMRNPGHFLLADMASHSTGVPGTNLLWYGSGLDRTRIVESLQHLAVTMPVRSTFAYNNNMYIALGQLMERLSGRRYEDILNDRLFHPLDMNRTYASVSAMGQAVQNVAAPHATVRDKITKIELRDLTNAAAAGGVLSTATDLATLLNAFLNPARNPDTPFDGELLRELFRPRIVIDPAGPPLQIDPSVTPIVTYGLGWFVTSHRGHRLIFHPGGFDGMSAVIALVPDLDLGIAVLSNADSNFGVLALQSEIIDLCLGVDDSGWSSRYHEAISPALAALHNVQHPDSPRFSLAGTPLDRESIAGKYRHPYLGTLVVREHQGELKSFWGDFEAGLKMVAPGVYRLVPVRKFSIPHPLVAQFATHRDAVSAAFFGESGWRRVADDSGADDSE